MPSEKTYLGRVVDIKDPLYQGRAKIDVFGFFDEIPVEYKASSLGPDKGGNCDNAKQWRWLLDLITVKRLRLILPTFNKNTLLGADGVRMRDLMASSDECLEHICGILKRAVISPIICSSFMNMAG